MRFPVPLFVAAVAAAAAGFAFTGRDGAAPALAREAPALAGPTVALLVTQPGAAFTALELVRAGEDAAPAPVARFDHVEGAAVKGATLPGTRAVLAIADTAAARDLSFAASLFRLEPHAPAERLCDGVVHASRPLITSAGRVFVSRGVAGAERAPTHVNEKLATRVDALSIDEIDPGTGQERTVHSFAGYLAFLAGAFGSELLVYRVGPGGADLVGVDPDTFAVRAVAPALLPFARDFSVDAASGAVVFEERDERDSRTWVVDRIDLASGARERLHAAPSFSLAPSAWPGGGVAYNPGGRAGLALLGRAIPGLAAPLGDGVDQVQAISADGAWVAALHTRPSRLPVPFAIEAATGRAAALPIPPGARAAVAGFVAGGAR